MKTKKIIYLILSSMVVAAAGSLYYFNFLYNPKKIEPPLAQQIPFDTLTFWAEKGLSYHHFTGSDVVIPKNAFVDKDGFPINGEIAVLYREFHSPEDILLSGIPMGELDNPDNKALQSAGMFQIAAFKGNQELKLADGKKIDVGLAAYDTSGGFSLFRLDKDSKWVETGSPEQATNDKKRKDLAAIPELPDKPFNPNVSEKDMIIELDADYNEYPQLAAFRNYKWKVVDVPENKEAVENPWGFRVNWHKLKIATVDKEKNLYKLTASFNQYDYENKMYNYKFSVIATPVLTGKNFEKALASFNEEMNEYNKLTAEIEKEEQRLALEADALNRFQIDQMGVWNCDRYINQYQFVKIKADFDFTREFNPYINKVRVYVINHTYNTVQDYMVRDWDKIYVRTGSSTSIMAVLPDNKIAIFGKEEFVKVDFDKINNSSREYFFNTKTFSADISEMKRLKEIL